MKRDWNIFYYPLFIVFSLLIFYSPSRGAEISSLDVTIWNDEIYVTTSLSLEEKHLQELRNGIAKEFRFYIDLFKVWNMWPDEFVLGKFFIRTLKCDPVKGEFTATSDDRSIIIEKRFKSFESMTQWALSVTEMTLTNIKELESGAYFVRVTVESKIRKLPPIVGYFLIFLPENEFKITKDSPYFTIGVIE